MTILNIVSTASRTGMQSAWMAWEGLFDQITKIRSVSVTQYGICKLVVRKHQGKSIACHDGYYINAGDYVGELHTACSNMMCWQRSLYLVVKLNSIHI